MAKTSWPIKTLGEVAVLNPSEPALSEDAPFVPMDAVTAGKRQVQYTQPRGQRSGARARAGDILFARITPCLQNGKVALVQDEIERCGGSTEFIVVRAGTDVLNGFLYQWITAKHIRDHVTALMKGATGRQRLNAEDLALTELPVPPLEEQKRLVALLDAATARVTELTSCYEQARTHANNLFTSALREALESNPDWPVKTLGDILTFSYGKPLEPKDRDDNGAIPVYGANGVKARSKRSLVSGPSIIVGRKGSAGELNFCDGPFWPLDVTYFVEHDVKVTDLTFLHYLLSLMDLPSLAKGVKPGINRNDVYVLQSPVPPLEQQKQIVERLDLMKAKTLEMIAAYDAKLTAAKNLRQSILESAFEGKL